MSWGSSKSSEVITINLTFTPLIYTLTRSLLPGGAGCVNGAVERQPGTKLSLAQLTCENKGIILRKPEREEEEEEEGAELKKEDCTGLPDGRKRKTRLAEKLLSL